MSDFLDKLAKEAKTELGNQESPYRLNKERTRTVQMRESTYKELKQMAFTRDTKMVDLLEEMLRYAIQNGNFKN